jgi:hypothetical protein
MTAALAIYKASKACDYDKYTSLLIAAIFLSRFAGHNDAALKETLARLGGCFLRRLRDERDPKLISTLYDLIFMCRRFGTIVGAVGADIAGIALEAADAVATTTANLEQTLRGLVKSIQRVQLGVPGPFSVFRMVGESQTPNIPNVRRNMTLALPSHPVATSGLKIWDESKQIWRVATSPAGGAIYGNMAVADVIYCAELGRMRFDTRLVRNLVWFVQLQRIMRVVLTRHLDYLNGPVTRGLRIADSKVTEFKGNEQYDVEDYNGTQYDMI